MTPPTKEWPGVHDLRMHVISQKSWEIMNYVIFVYNDVTFDYKSVNVFNRVMKTSVKRRQLALWPAVMVFCQVRTCLESDPQFKTYHNHSR